MMTHSGYLFDIKHFSTHDGPGIRTTLFFSGCPLTCLWCHNPEAIFDRLIKRDGKLLMHHDQTKCIGCGNCVRVCQVNAIRFSPTAVEFDHTICTSCGDCMRCCPNDAIYRLAEKYTIQDIITIIDKDAVFYGDREGGVTVSGGEPFFQPEFLFELLSELKGRCYKVCVDTSGYFETCFVERLDDVSLLFDLKVIDDEKHRQFTGVSNKLILKNLRKVDEYKIDTMISIPLIPGLNTEKKDVADFIDFVQSLRNIKKVRLLKYHDFAVNKYKRLGLDYKLEHVKKDDDQFEHIRESFINHGINIC